MKILLAQLPLIDHARGYLYGNVEYGPASIAAYLRRNFGAAAEVRLLPQAVSCFGSDGLIARYIAAERPDIVGFTCFLWNVERVLGIARTIRDSGVKTIILGGPEIEAGSVVFEGRNAADFLVSGEGEWFFSRLISGRDMSRYAADSNGTTLVTQPGDELISAESIVEPFSQRMLDVGLDGTAYLELVRGCPHRCSYCFYSKRSRIVRELAFEVLLGAIEGRRGMKELYIMSPTFNRSHAFRDRLTLLARRNPGVALHTEMRAGGIDRETAAMMYRAGFRSLEVGLQTLNRRALEIAGRRGDPEEELAGMRHLRDAGISLKIGIIPGLPGDDPDSCIKTVDRLIDLGFAGEIELYPLMVLPGTAVRQYAEAEGFIFQRRPPYLLQSGGAFSFRDIAGIGDYVEERTGYTQRVPSLPDFTSHERGLFIQGVRFDGNDPDRWDGRRYLPLIEMNVFSFHVAMAAAHRLYDGLPRLLEGLPESELFNIVLYTDELLDEERIGRIVGGRDTDCFYRRLHLFEGWAEGLRFRIYQVFGDAKPALRALDAYSMVEPILAVAGRFPAGIQGRGLNLLIDAGAYAGCAGYLKRLYAENPEQVAFQSEADAERFYRDIGMEYFRLPYSFRTVAQ